MTFYPKSQTTTLDVSVYSFSYIYPFRLLDPRHKVKRGPYKTPRRLRLYWSSREGDGKNLIILVRFTVIVVSQSGAETFLFDPIVTQNLQLLNLTFEVTL